MKTNRKIFSKKRRSLLYKGAKWAFVGAIWSMLLLCTLVFVYAYDLPDIEQAMKFERRPTVSILASDHSVIDRYGESQGRHLMVEDVSPHLKNAILAIEDRRFYSHFGVDPFGLARAMATNVVKGRFVQGGSTITQQLAKVLFLNPEKKLSRKIKEALTALWLEFRYTKDEILSAYINRVYLGSGTYGFDAAAQRYFEKSASNTNLYESALLAGLLKAPSSYSPISNPEKAQDRAEIVLSAMVDANYITEKEKAEALANKTKSFTPNKPVNNSRYFTDWIYDQVRAYVGESASDIIVYTTFAPDIQSRASSALQNAISAVKEERHVSQGAALVLSKNGAVRAMIGGYDFKESQFNRTTQSLRQPGSAFKSIVYLSAIENLGISPNDIVLDERKSYGSYSPQNYDKKYHGEVTIRDAFAHSLNTIAVEMAQATGIGNVIQTARNLGITSALQPDLSTALGSSEVSMMELATAYAVIANDGYAVQPFGIIEVKTLDGETLYQHDYETEQPRLFNRGDIGDLKEMMREVLISGTGRSANIDPIPAWGKTGTTEEYRDAWFIGFTNDFVGAVWLGNDDNTSMSGVTGGSIPAQIWRNIMKDINTAAPYIEREPEDKSKGALDNLLNFFRYND